MDSEAAPVGRTAAKGSRTGPNTLTTRPSGRFRLSRTSAPREGANSAWTRTVPSWAIFSTTPRRLMPPLVRARYACLVLNGNGIIFVAVVAKRKASGHEFRLQTDPLGAPRNRGQSLARGPPAPLRLAVSTLLPLFPNRLYAAPLGELARRGNLHPSAFDGRAAPMKLVPFEMERWQSTWEHSVEFNLSESGVEPLPLRELLRDDASVEHFLNHPLADSPGNGTPEVRSSIAGMYRGATPEQVLVTNGSSEACPLALLHLREPGDEGVLQ